MTKSNPDEEQGDDFVTFRSRDDNTSTSTADVNIGSITTTATTRLRPSKIEAIRRELMDTTISSTTATHNIRDSVVAESSTRRSGYNHRPGVQRRQSSFVGDIIHYSQRRSLHQLPTYVQEDFIDQQILDEINEEVDIADDDGEDGNDEAGAVELSSSEHGSFRLNRNQKRCCGGQWKKMKRTADWWSLWIGLSTFMMAVALVFIVPYDFSSYRVKYIIPRPMRWETNPFDAWDWYSFAGTILLLAFFCSLYLLSLVSMGKLDNVKDTASTHCKGFMWMGLIATLSLWVGSNRWCSLNGLSYAIFSIVFGMIITNTPMGNWSSLQSLKVTSKCGEFFIKCSLTLLATEFSILAEFGWQAIVVAWVGSPVALVMGYFISTKLLKMETNIALLSAVGATWCGASAISATGSAIEASKSDMTLSISVVAFFTVIFTFVQPYIAIGVGMDERVAGSWIGASVDQTGNVIASAAIISEYATEVAGIVKIVLNSGLGILCTVVAFWYQNKMTSNGKKFSMMYLWDKFPKFVIGYFVCSGALSLMLPFINGTPQADAMQRAVIDCNKWWFALGFVGIGVGTNLKDLYAGAKGSGVVQGYLISNFLDIGIALALSYALFK